MVVKHRACQWVVGHLVSVQEGPERPKALQQPNAASSATAYTAPRAQSEHCAAEHCECTVSALRGMQREL